MSFKLSLVALVDRDSAFDSDLDAKLLRMANAWLQRRTANASDDLLLIGVGFKDEPVFQAMLRPYGLAGAALDVIPSEEFDESDDTALGDSIESIASKWIAKQHSNATPL